MNKHREEYTLTIIPEEDMFWIMITLLLISGFGTIYRLMGG